MVGGLGEAGVVVQAPSTQREEEKEKEKEEKLQLPGVAGLLHVRRDGSKHTQRAGAQLQLFRS